MITRAMRSRYAVSDVALISTKTAPKNSESSRDLSVTRDPCGRLSSAPRFPWMASFSAKSSTASSGEKFDLLLGRKTYEIFAAYWPYYDDDAPMAASPGC